MPNFKHVKISLFTALALCFCLSDAFAAKKQVLVKNINFTAQDRLEIITSEKNTFKIFTLENPSRLVVDIDNGKLAEADLKPVLPSFITSFRSKNNFSSLRLVFELNQKVTIQKARFEKVKNHTSGKITAELIRSGEVSAAKVQVSETQPVTKFDPIVEKVAEFDVQTEKIINPDGSAKYIVRKIPKSPEVISKSNKASITAKLPIIVIDSGHGGKDPGTIGNFARTKEKNITLSYAKELGKLLVNTKRYKVYLTRDTDDFIPLRKRVEIARKKKADLFISIHANATSDKSTSGFSIYTLSEKSSDKQAELLAQKENRADIINGMDFSDASKDIVKTLIDLSQREAKNSSAIFANTVIKSVKKSDIDILQNTHRFAGFAVLTAPDMASVLIELGYLSNKTEEKSLNSISYKRKIAESLVEAIDEYFAKNKT
jgi:N-acetylmuramoyl-L-alanine amidase